ncbi:DNA translocase FtsK [Dehalobacter sp. DCM]|uniref:DNA translocase FtsK n=1 Tax=Dehalobacter sp. DCM TaxID=2907827 RepID=UPI0030819119|nr:DNA translocase FtsK [Dehalobacter sp. DCM]
MATKKTRRGARSKRQTVSQTIRNEIIGILIVGIACLGFVLLYSNGNGTVVAALVKGLRLLAGEGSIGIFIILGAVGIGLMSTRKSSFKSRIAGIILLWLVAEGFIHLGLSDNDLPSTLMAMARYGQGGGIIGAAISMALVKTIGPGGGFVILAVLAVIGAILALNRSLVATVKDVLEAMANGAGLIRNHLTDFVKVLADGRRERQEEETYSRQKALAEKKKSEPNKMPVKNVREDFDTRHSGPIIEIFGEEKDKTTVPNPPIIQTERNTPAFQSDSELPAGKLTSTPIQRKTEKYGNYKLPPLTLVHKSMKKGQRTNKDIADNVKLLEETLASFGVRVKVTRVTQGPAITRFELQPAPGVKVSKITSLSDDIALSLAASDIRMEAPIPGKSAVGIEVPNKEVAIVHFREVLETDDFQDSQSKLSLALGKDITGTPIIGDLTKMPHLLIAGATGSGKSVCINTIIGSIVYKARPDEVKLLLIDPKVVELAIYNGIPHLISPVVTEPQKAAGALKWIVTEMETRYELFAVAGVRDIVRYNFLVSEKKDPEQKPMPYVVVIIDELADLMMVAPGEVEDSICRLAQMARAAGIHLIVATQRPSVDVITGLIKANIPSRIAFAVSSQIDSRTILDMGGAEKLLGRGDMLYHPMGISKPVRVQGCFLSDKEVRNIVDYLLEQAKPEYFEIPEMALASTGAEEPEDELFYKAAAVFMETNTASVSLLQRKLKIGYSRAARIVDMLEEKGVVGPSEGSKPREVLLSKGQFEQKFGINLNN